MMPLPIIRDNVCGCFTVRTAALIISWYSVITYTFIFVTLFAIEVLVFRENHLLELTNEEQRVFSALFTTLVFVLLVRGVLLFTSILLLKGVIEKIPHLMLPWIIMKSFTSVSDLLTIFLDVGEAGAKQTVIELIRLGFSTYLYLVIYSYYITINYDVT